MTASKGVGKCLECSLKSREASVSVIGREWKNIVKDEVRQGTRGPEAELFRAASIPLVVCRW